jgi:hypothetical protein
MPRDTWGLCQLGLCQLGMGLQALADAAVDDPGPLRERHDGTPIVTPIPVVNPGGRMLALGTPGRRNAPAVNRQVPSAWLILGS